MTIEADSIALMTEVRYNVTVAKGIAMFNKGAESIDSALFLMSKKGQSFPGIHLLCLGIELTIKGIVVLDKPSFDWAALRKAPFNHLLVEMSDAAIKQFQVNPLRQATRVELSQLARWYPLQMRYGSMLDIFIRPQSVEISRVVRRARTLVCLAKRAMMRDPHIASLTGLYPPIPQA